MRDADYRDTVGYLYGLQKYGIKFGLDNTIRLLSLLGDPQRSFRSIHIAGTNGKGSTSAMIASILRAAGLRVGLFTSPHLVSFTERIRVDGVEIQESEVVALTEEIREAMGSVNEVTEKSKILCGTGGADSPRPVLTPTFFEFVTAMAFLHFKRRGVGWGVVETGMGGRLDATNVITPAVSVITDISLDHKEFLGQTLKEVAAEKAGIIKEGVPVVSAKQEAEAGEVLWGTARERRSHLFIYERDFRGIPRSQGIGGITFDYIDDSCVIRDLHIPLAGDHQLSNACLAIKASLIALGGLDVLYTMRSGVKRDPSLMGSPGNQGFLRALREGLALTKWPGRLELIRDAGMPDVLIDGAHNPAASRVLADSLKRYFLPSYEQIILILGIMSDKDIEGIMRPLLPIASRVIVTAPDYERAAPPSRLAECARFLGYDTEIAGSVKEALRMAVKTATGDSALVVITGSFYTIGEAKMHLGQPCNCPSMAGLR